MPILTVPKSLYPLVPNAPGVPALLRAGAQILDTITLGYLGIGDALNSLIGEDPVKWAVLDSTGKALPYESVNAVGYQNESRVSDYPLENGAFAAYNKVDSPFDVIVTLTQGGAEEDRRTMIKAVENARKSLDLYTVMVPEGVYRNVNFTSLTIQRSTREGATLIIATLSGREIRQKASAAYSQPKIPAASTTQARGQVQIISDPTLDATGVV